MKRIPLTQGKYAIVNDSDFAFLRQFSWQLSSNGYAKTTISMHRLILMATKGSIVDHRDGNRINNRRTNIRLCDSAQNNQHRTRTAKKSKSGFKGVDVYWGRWRARIKHRGKRYNLGVFSTEAAARMAYDLWAMELHRDFAVTNSQVVGFGP